MERKGIIDPDSISFKVGQNIARIRKQNGLTQSDMEIFQISRAYYGRIELGLHSLTIEKLELIAKAFGVPISQLFINEDNQPII